jgi:hypothetical protein
LCGRWIVEQAEEEIEVRTRPQHEVVIRHDFVVVALACALPEPIAHSLAFMCIEASVLRPNASRATTNGVL